jgi:putative transposase
MSSKAIRRTFGRAAAIQRCQIHKARNIMERLPKSLHASVRRVLRQAWELDDADKAEKLIRNLAQRLERDWSGVSGSILEGIDEILTVTRLGLPKELRRSLACTNIIENVMGTVRRVCRNVKRWRSASMALRSPSAHARGCPGVPHCRSVGPGPEPVPVGVAVVGDELDVRPALSHATNEG